MSLECEGGVWEGATPLCRPVSCPAPAAPAAGRVAAGAGQRYSWGATAVYTCLPGYGIEGEDTVYCTGEHYHRCDM